MMIIIGIIFIFTGISIEGVIVPMFFISQSLSNTTQVPMVISYIFGGLGALLIIIGVVLLAKGIRNRKTSALSNQAGQMGKADGTFKESLTGKLLGEVAGEQWVNNTNDAMEAASEYYKQEQIEQYLRMTGRDGVADVLSIRDTGSTIHDTIPIVYLTLNVTPSVGNPFQMTKATVVPRLAIPRVGDRLRVRYNPDNTSQIIFPDFQNYR